MATTDPNPPVKKDARAEDVWTDEADGTPGSPDTTLVTGNLGQGTVTSLDTTAVNTGKQPTSHAEIDGANVETDGVYVSGYPLGTQEDDTTNPTHLAPNTSTGQKVDNYTGTTNGASIEATVVPGDTTQARGESFDTTTKYLASTPGAKQPDITSGADVFFGAEQGSPSNEVLDTLSFKGGAGTLPANYGAVAASSGTSNAQFGQANNTPGELDTTNTAMPTAVSFNDGTAVSLPTSYSLHTIDTTNIDGAWAGLTAGKDQVAPQAPTGVSWTFGPGRAIVSWTAPVTPTLSAPVQANTVVTSTDGGTWGATGTYYYKVTATNSRGETIASNEKSGIVAAATDSVTVSWAAVTGATGYKVYRGTSAGAENKLVATVSSGATVSYKDLGVAGATASVPGSNTATSVVDFPVREYLVYGYQVRSAANLPGNDTDADKMKGQHTVSAHAHALVRVKVDGTTQTEELGTQVEIDRLTPGDYYYFRVQARNDADYGPLSTVVGITYPTAPATPYYRLSEAHLDASAVVVPGWTEPEGATLTDLTFTNSPGIDELGNNLTGEDATELAAEGEEGEDRI